MGEFDEISYSKAIKNEQDLADMSQFTTVAAVDNTYTLDLANKPNKNFSIETGDANAKAIAFSNVSQADNTIITVNVRLIYTNAAAITHPAGTAWKDAATPSFTAGKKYILVYTSYDKGVTWKAASIGAW